MLEKLETIERRYEELNGLLSQAEVASDYEHTEMLVREQAPLRDIVAKYREYKATLKSIEEAKGMLQDDEIATLANEELEHLKAHRDRLLDEIKGSLLPRDPADDRDVIMEIRAGAGGEEAGLFAADLFRMYAHYAQAKGWGMDIISSNETGIGGFKEIILEIQGKGAYSRLKYERGCIECSGSPSPKLGEESTLQQPL